MDFLGLDLNFEFWFCDPAGQHGAGWIDEPRQAGIRTTPAASSVDHFSPLRRALSRGVYSAVVFLPGPVPVHDLHAVDVPGEPSGHRAMPAGKAIPALSLRNSFNGG